MLDWAGVVMLETVGLTPRKLNKNFSTALLLLPPPSLLPSSSQRKIIN